MRFWKLRTPGLMRFFITLMNRWRTKENARGTVRGMDMRQTYTQVRDVMNILKLYSKSL